MVSLWILSRLKSCTSILDQLKEDVMKIQQQNTWERFSNFRKDQEHIADFQVKLNSLVSISHVFTILHHLFHLIIQSSFQTCFRVEENSQEAGKSSHKYFTWYYFSTCTDAKRNEDLIMTKHNKDDISIERRNIGERPTTTENCMYKLAF